MGFPALLRGPSSVGLCFGLIASLAPASAVARCDSNAALHACIDADTLWLPTRAGRLLSLGDTEALVPGSLALGWTTTVLSKPIVLRVPSPGGPVEVAAVDMAVNGSLAASFALAKRWDVGVTLPMTLHQTGAGVAPYQSSNAERLAPFALRDPRIGASYAILPRDAHPATADFGLMVRLEVGLPLGNENAFASEPGPVFAPTLTADVRSGVLHVGAEVGARLRETTRFASARFGSQAVAALAVGVDVLREVLSFGVEARAMPVLLSQPSGDGLVPAEWMAFARMAPFADADWAFALGGGSALPLGDASLTAPRWRAVLSIQYAIDTALLRDAGESASE